MAHTDVNISHLNKLPSLKTIAEKTYKAKHMFRNLNSVSNGSISYKDLIPKSETNINRILKKRKQKVKGHHTYFTQTEEYKVGKVRINNIAKAGACDREQFITNLIYDKPDEQTKQDKLYLTRKLLSERDVRYAYQTLRRDFGFSNSDLSVEDVKEFMSPASFNSDDSKKEKVNFETHSFIQSSISKKLHNYTYNNSPKRQTLKILRSLSDSDSSFKPHSFSQFSSLKNSSDKTLKSRVPSKKPHSKLSSSSKKPRIHSKSAKFIGSLNIIQEIEAKREEVKPYKDRMHHLMIMKNTFKDSN